MFTKELCMVEALALKEALEILKETGRQDLYLARICLESERGFALDIANRGGTILIDDPKLNVKGEYWANPLPPWALGLQEEIDHFSTQRLECGDAEMFEGDPNSPFLYRLYCFYFEDMKTHQLQLTIGVNCTKEERDGKWSIGHGSAWDTKCSFRPIVDHRT